MRQESDSTELVPAGQAVLTKKELALPEYDTLTDQRVVAELKTVFKKFDYDPAENIQQKFKTMESFAAFLENGKKEIEELDLNLKKNVIKSTGAIMVKRWYQGNLIARFIKDAPKGSDAVGQLVKVTGYSQSYIYQFKDVGANLQLKDAYILGMYGVGWDTIRALSTVRDGSVRNTLVKLFVSMIKDFNNVIEREVAKKTLIESIEQARGGKTVDIDSTSMAQIQAANNLEEIAPEYVMAMKRIIKIDSALKSLSKEEFMEETVNLLADCFIMEDIADANERCAAINGKAEELIKKIKKFIDMSGGLLEQLQSIVKMNPTKKE